MGRSPAVAAGALALAALLATPAAARQLTFSGLLEADGIGYAEDAATAKVDGRREGTFELTLRSRLGRKVTAFARGEARWDATDSSRERLRLEEGYLDLRLGPVDLRLGKQIIVWGRTDSVNPTDNLTAWDFSDILDTEDERLGEIAANLEYYFGGGSLQVVLIPEHQPSRLPAPDSRWFPDPPPLLPDPRDPSRILPVELELLPPRPVDDGLDDPQVGLRLTARPPGWDVSVSVFDGWNDLPGFRTTADLEGDSLTLRLAPEFHRLRVWGVDFATVAGRTGVRGEAAYFETEDPDGIDRATDDPYLHYVLGVERTFTDLVGDDDLRVVLEWSHQIAATDIRYDRRQFDHIFERSLLSRLTWSLTEFLEVETDLAYNLREDDWLLAPRVAWEPRAGLTLEAGVDLLGGDRSGFFGSFRGNRRLQAKATYRFDIGEWGR